VQSTDKCVEQFNKFHCQCNVFRTGSTESHYQVAHRRKGGGIVYLASQTSWITNSTQCCTLICALVWRSGQTRSQTALSSYRKTKLRSQMGVLADEPLLIIVQQYVLAVWQYWFVLALHTILKPTELILAHHDRAAWLSYITEIGNQRPAGRMWPSQTFLRPLTRFGNLSLREGQTFSVADENIEKHTFKMF
jgi:hypothetical protein